jgi:hypothetical protein
MLTYKVSRELGIVTVYPPRLPPMWNREAFAVDLDESDLLAMLLALRNSQRDPEAQLAGS